MLWCVMAPLDCEPERPEAEKLGPVTVQLFAFEELHVIVEASPVRTRRGSAVIERLGCKTVTVTFF